MLYRYKLSVAYDGTLYGGWQVQPNATSIQSLIEKALSTLLRHHCALTGSGRTDGGVHALAQVAHFSTHSPIDCPKILASLNGLLPKDIRVFALEPTCLDFHARYSATAKIYHYHLHLSAIPDPFTHNYATSVFGPCDLRILKMAAKDLVGTHDFTSFANDPGRGSAAHNAVRTLFRLDVVDTPNGVRLEFEGDGFLYKMVRNMVGTLLDIAAGKLSPDAIPNILAAKDRRAAGKAAPAQGLFLVAVKYTQTT